MLPRLNTPSHHLLLAQQSGTGTGTLLLWLGILIIITILGGLLIMAVRRKLHAGTDDSDTAGSLMDNLRAMRDRGEISAEEFEQTRTAIRSRLRRNLAEQESKPSVADGSGPGRPGMKRP